MKNLFKICLYAFLTFALFSCKEEVRETYNEVNPNDPTNAPADVIIPGVVTGTHFFHSGESARLATMWAGHFTGRLQYLGCQAYNATASDMDSPWSIVYADIYDVAQVAKEKAAEVNQKDILGIAAICQAHAMGTAADLWGDIPFTEAGEPIDFPEPRYDAQVSVYENVQELLDEGIANAAGIATYSGSTSLGDWGEVAYTLKARNYMHTRDYRKAIDAAAHGISSVANNWMGNHNADVITAYNVYYNFCEVERNGFLIGEGAYLVDLLDNIPDNTSYRGDDKTDETARFNWYYVKQPEVYNSYADPNTVDGMFTAGASFPLVTYVENQLIIAEANHRLGEVDKALAALNDARAAHDVKYGTGDGTTYAAYEMGDFVNDAALLEEIIEEKYVSMYAQIEAFTDMRRTKNVIGVPINNGGAIPERFFYPQSEINSNTNTPSPIPGLFEPTPINQ